MVVDSANIEVKAEFSEDRKLRFTLKKTWDIEEPSALFILLNPSKADVLRMDNTFCNIINQCIDLKFGSVTLVNLFPIMATEQKELKGKLDIGKNENYEVIGRELMTTDTVFIAWGSEHKKYSSRKSEIEHLLKKCDKKTKILCWFDENKNYPKHLRIVGKTWELSNYEYVF
ncbi:DUF1643 domain-containing protein [Aliiglaciecola sp. NS0011-25]|uniref:DUF1643 domain-containing protein n=1 Tax=Aliiglaciecola sp. NS0011-25 TaxID=3127654 RepID=UPI00310C7377